MSHAADIAKILEQERLLEVDGFTEADAFAIGNAHG